MTGRLRKGDIVDTPDGTGQIVIAHATLDDINPQSWHVVLLDNGRRKLYRRDQIELVARQLPMTDPNP